MPTCETVRLSVDRFFDEWRPLAEEQWRTMEEPDAPFVPDVMDALLWERKGVVRFVGLLVDGERAGYAVVVANDDVFRLAGRLGLVLALYVRPDCRSLAAARALLRAAEDAARAMGCRTITVASRHPAGGPNLEPLLQRAGYRAREVWYVRGLP